MSYTGLRFGGANAVTTRPADKPPITVGDTWARDRAGGVPGTEIDATFANRLKANFENAVVRIGGDLNDGDDQLANALEDALDAKVNVVDLDEAVAGLAPLNSPAFTGEPTAPTADTADNSTKIATTALVTAKVAALLSQLMGGAASEALDTLLEIGAALDNDPDFAGTMTTALAGKQPLHALLTALAGLTTAANKGLYFTGENSPATFDLSAFGRTLAALADAAAGRAALELGSAALLTAGTAANNAVQLDGDAKLPALDGSQLTGLPGGTFTASFESSQQTITQAGALTLAHGLGAAPKIVECLLVCQTAEAGYAIGDVVVANPSGCGYTEGGYGLGLLIDATNLVIRFGSSSGVFIVAHKSTGVRTTLTAANWRLIVRAFA